MQKSAFILLILIFICLGTVFGQSFCTEEGKASYYGSRFNGRKTANGEIFRMNELTAAHPHLPFNTLVKVTNIQNNKSVIVRINDRGPFSKSRIIDISKSAAVEIDMVKRGVAHVKVELFEEIEHRNKKYNLLLPLERKGLYDSKNRI